MSKREKIHKLHCKIRTVFMQGLSNKLSMDELSSASYAAAAIAFGFIACKECGGSGEVFSHITKCWDCEGTGWSAANAGKQR